LEGLKELLFGFDSGKTSFLGSNSGFFFLGDGQLLQPLDLHLTSEFLGFLLELFTNQLFLQL